MGMVCSRNMNQNLLNFTHAHTCIHTHTQNITCHFKIQLQPGEAIKYFHEQYIKSKNEADIRNYNLLFLGFPSNLNEQRYFFLSSFGWLQWKWLLKSDVYPSFQSWKLRMWICTDNVRIHILYYTLGSPSSDREVTILWCRSAGRYVQNYMATQPTR